MLNIYSGFTYSIIEMDSNRIETFRKPSDAKKLEDIAYTAHSSELFKPIYRNYLKETYSGYNSDSYKEVI